MHKSFRLLLWYDNTWRLTSFVPQPLSWWRESRINILQNVNVCISLKKGTRTPLKQQEGCLRWVNVDNFLRNYPFKTWNLDFLSSSFQYASKMASLYERLKWLCALKQDNTVGSVPFTLLHPICGSLLFRQQQPMRTRRPDYLLPQSSV